MCSGGTKPFWDGNGEGQVSSEKASPLTLGRRGRVRGSSGKAARTKGKFTFYVLIPFMMIFSCVEYPILVVVWGGWWCTVDCFSRLSEPFVFSLLYITLVSGLFLDDSSSRRSVETI